MQDFFDIVVVIDTLRKMKPDVEVFHYALQKLKTTPSSALFIEDKLETDYKGAQRAGLMADSIDREDKVHNANVDKMSSLYDLFRLNIVE